MIILTIVCVPLLRGFATSAQTSANAKIQMKATTAAENTMEKIKNMTTPELDQLVEEYMDIANVNNAEIFETNKGNQAVRLTINDSDEIKADLPSGYYTEVYLDPDGQVDWDGDGNPDSLADQAYPNANGLNLSDFNRISVRDCAIYTMDTGYDEAVYNVFVDRNTNFVATHPSATSHDANWFKENLVRTFTLKITSPGGTVGSPAVWTDPEGNDHVIAKVELEIEYKCKQTNVVGDTEADKTYKPVSVILFDNSATHTDLNGIYLFYYPRYTAANMPTNYNSAKERVSISNTFDIDTDLYITAMHGAADEATPTGTLTSYARDYIDYKKMFINIAENNSSFANVSNGDKAHINLRTNLLKTYSVTELRTPYSTSDNTQNPSDYMGCTVNYDCAGIDPGGVGDTIKALTLSDIDGKAVDASDTKVRIYRVSVYVKDSSDDSVKAHLEGTKLRQE